MISRTKLRKGFTLIELLVVIAIIAILAAILFPVFAQVREKARQASCESNCKQFSMAILQYTNDYDEAMPLTYKDQYMYGPDTAPYNTTVDGGNKTQTGVPFEIMPYVKSVQVFQCPDDHPAISAGSGGSNEMDTSASGAAPINAPVSALKGHYYAGIYGTSYKFTNQSYSKGADPVAGAGPFITNTGYDALKGCVTTTTKKCEFIASGGISNSVDASGNDVYIDSNPYSGTGYSTVKQADFARPAETRIMGDWQKTYQGQPAPKFAPFHPNGSTIGFADGHVKFVVSLGDYKKGCDGIDWSWDIPGNCNNKGFQRQAD